MTKFGMVIQVKEKRVCSGQPRPILRGRSPSVQKLFGIF